MTILTHQRDRAIVERRQDYRAARVMDDFPNVSPVPLAHGIDSHVEDAAGEDIFRIYEFRRLCRRLSHVWRKLLTCERPLPIFILAYKCSVRRADEQRFAMILSVEFPGPLRPGTTNQLYKRARPPALTALRFRERRGRLKQSSLCLAHSCWAGLPSTFRDRQPEDCLVQ